MRRHGPGAVNRQDVLRTGRKGQDHMALGAREDVVPRLCHRWFEVDTAIRGERNVHPQVERTGNLGRSEAKLGHGGVEVVRAVVVVPRDAEERVPIAIAGGNDSIVNTG